MDKNNYFLGTVGSVSAFRRNSTGGLELAFVSTTNTEQGLNTTVSADDLRGGQGAPVITRFYHDVSVEVTLTDIIFKEAYVRSQLGTDFQAEGKAYFCETLDVEGNTVTLSHDPSDIEFGCNAGSKKAVWYATAGKNNWVLAEDSEISDKTLTINTSKLGETPTTITVRYLASGLSGAIEAKVYSNFVPEELFLIVDVPLFAGDACAASNGGAAGSVQFEIPRFRLNGGQDFAAAMSSNQTVNMSGAAMATMGGCGAKGSYLYKIIINYETEKLGDRYRALEVLDESLKAGAMPIVYGIDGQNNAELVNNSLLTFSPALADGKFSTAGATTITAADGSTLTKTVTVAA